MRQSFGGPWTETKLQALGDYLKAYMTIMKGNPQAQNFRTTYLDGFAGSGRRYGKVCHEPQSQFAELQETDVQEFYTGSARRALELEKPFDKYIFVEIDHEAAKELKDLHDNFSEREIRIEVADANVFIPEWCKGLEWNDRALVFLDPYGMQVDWSTIQALARTNKVDLWVLVPLGQAIVRLLTKKQPPAEWAAALTRFFGTDDWRDHFYVIKESTTLFGEQETVEREVDFESVTSFIIERLGAVFSAVLDTPVVLRNSMGNPLYLLCFAASNPKGAQTAIKIAKDIARKLNDGR